jgi:hypothetical protein
VDFLETEAELRLTPDELCRANSNAAVAGNNPRSPGTPARDAQH